jgi:hypothetical protein
LNLARPWPMQRALCGVICMIAAVAAELYFLMKTSILEEMDNTQEAQKYNYKNDKKRGAKKKKVLKMRM